MSNMLEILRELREITATPESGCTRLAYTEFEDRAHDHVWRSLSDITALTRVEDAAGNTFIVPKVRVADRSPIILIGSHLDTVIEGGWLDGALGVAAGMHVLRCKAKEPNHLSRLGLVIFRDEEGVRFNTGLFGSRVFAGLCTPEDLDARDTSGISVGDVVRDPSRCCRYEPPVNPECFLECHIEQGERLLVAGRSIGVVTGIVGIRRFEIVAQGAANHAGTTEMSRRVDALVPIANIVANVPRIVDGIDDAVATCGRMEVKPGAPNVVPGSVSAIVEIRAPGSVELDKIENRLMEMVRSLEPAVSGGRLAQVSVRPLTTAAPLATDKDIARRLGEILDRQGTAHRSMSSMAGHDTQMASVRCPSGMFFIPSIGGVSHSPEENSTDEDILLAGEVMLRWVEGCLETCL